MADDEESGIAWGSHYLLANARELIEVLSPLSLPLDVVRRIWAFIHAAIVIRTALTAMSSSSCLSLKRWCDVAMHPIELYDTLFLAQCPRAVHWMIQGLRRRYEVTPELCARATATPSPELLVLMRRTTFAASFCALDLCDAAGQPPMVKLRSEAEALTRQIKDRRNQARRNLCRVQRLLSNTATAFPFFEGRAVLQRLESVIDFHMKTCKHFVYRQLMQIHWRDGETMMKVKIVEDAA